MKIRYRGKQKGWRIFLWKGAIQIDIGGKSPKCKFPVVGLNAWDTLREGFMYIECYKDNGLLLTSVGFDKFSDNEHVESELFYVNPRLARTGCNTVHVCNAFKKYKKKGSNKQNDSS